MPQTSRINQRSDSGTATDADRPLADDGHHATDADVEMFQNQLPVRPNSQFSERSYYKRRRRQPSQHQRCRRESAADTS